MLEYLLQFGLLGTNQGNRIVRGVCPLLLDVGTAAVDQMLERVFARQYTQVGLAEALRFRETDVRESDARLIRFVALHAIRKESLSEIYIPTEHCLEESRNLVRLVGLVDAVHVHLLRQDDELILLTDDGRLRHHAGQCADRIIEFKDVLQA